MITKEKLGINLKVLKSKIPVKPESYTQTYPKTIKEALSYYCNQRTVHGVQACTKSLNDENWPLPLWINPDNAKVGFFNWFNYRKQYNSWQSGKKFKGLKGYDFFWAFLCNHILFKRTYDEIIIEAFDANRKYAFRTLSANPILKTKSLILESIHKNYKRCDWVACISTTFPLIDFIARKILRTTNLKFDILKICKLFKENGFSLETAGELMPHFTFVSSRQEGVSFYTKEKEDWFQKMIEYDFGLIGPALSSFIRFANIYYSYYKEDQEEETTLLNRHAILHGSIDHFGSKENTVKLLTFLYLTVELESVFEILFNE